MTYAGICALRSLLIVVLISFTTSPQKTSDFANLLFIAFDAIFVSSLTIWGTMIQFDAPADTCRNSDDEWVILMYVMSICCLLFGWVYVILLCCGLTSVPLIAIFWCCYRKQVVSMNRQQNGARKKSEAEKVQKSLKTQIFLESDRKADSCIICIEKFKAEDIVS